MSLPNTITKAHIQEALSKSLREQISIKELKVQKNETGGNYCSDIYRITVKFTINDDDGTQLQELKLLLKDMFETFAHSSKESFMYGTVLPELNKLLNAVQDGARFSARNYLIQSNVRTQYLLEDLNARGYKIVDRLLGFNESQTKCVLEKLAQFHATSLVYQEKHPDAVADLKGTGFRNYIDFCVKVINDNVAYVSKIIEKWPHFEGIAEKLRRNTGEIFADKFLGCLERQDCLVTVILHADLWINNILIKENEENQPVDAIFVDYQGCSLGSPGIDFNNFLLTSAQLEVMNSDEKYNALVYHYYESLQKTLVGLGYVAERIPTKQTIELELEKSQYFSYYSLLLNVPETMLCKDLAKDMNFDAFYDDERMAINRKNMFSNERVLATYRHMLPKFDQMGLFD